MPVTIKSSARLRAIHQLETTAPDKKTAEAYLDTLRRLMAPEDVMDLAEIVAARILEAKKAISAGNLEHAKGLIDNTEQLNAKTRARLEAVVRQLRSKTGSK